MRRYLLPNKWFDISWYGILISGTLTALAAFAGVVFLVVQFWYSSIRDKYSEIRTLEIEERGKQAELKIREAQKSIIESDRKIAEANARGAEANQKAQEAALKLAQLEKKVIPRVINDNDAVVFVEKIKLFAGTPFTVESDPAAEYGFVNRVIELLQRGGWNWRSYSTSLMSLPAADARISDGSGVQLRFNNSRIGDFAEAANALSHALTDSLRESSSVIFDPADSPLACSPDAIHVEIHRKL